MSPVDRVRSIHERLGVWATVITFALGFVINWGINAVTNANKVDFLTQKVAEMSVKLDKCSDKIDANNAQEGGTINSLGNRTTALEVKVFGKAGLP